MRSFILVDDGYPESSDYENNYIGFDPRKPGDYERALAEAYGGSIRITPASRPAVETLATATSLWRWMRPALWRHRG